MSPVPERTLLLLLMLVLLPHLRPAQRPRSPQISPCAPQRWPARGHPWCEGRAKARAKRRREWRRRQDETVGGEHEEGKMGMGQGRRPRRWWRARVRPAVPHRRRQGVPNLALAWCAGENARITTRKTHSKRGAHRLRKRNMRQRVGGMKKRRAIVLRSKKLIAE